MKILVIQTAFIGDVVLTTPFLEELRNRHPNAEVHVIATPQGCELLAGLEGLRCHALDKKGMSVSKGIRKLLAELAQEGQFDVVFAVHRSLRSLALGKKVKARRRIGFRSFWARVFGYETVVYPKYAEETHYADRPLALLARLEKKTSPNPRGRPKLVVGAAAASQARIKLAHGGIAEGQPYLVLSPFSVWGTKMWFADRYARVAAEVSKKHALPVVVIGGGAGAETVVGSTIVEKVAAAGGQAISLVGRTGLGELVAVIKNARLVLANDSAPVHMAAAFDVPTVAIFGPTARKWGFFPLSTKSIVVERHDVPCRPCHLHGPERCPRGHFRCMNEIEVEDVLNAVENLLR